MTADPSRYSERLAAWFLVTDQALRLGGPFEAREDALAAHVRVVETMAEQMQLQRYTGGEIAARVRAVVVAWGVLVGPWQRFEERLPMPAA